MREGGRDLAFVESLTANLYSFNFNTLPLRKTERLLPNTALQQKGHSVRYLEIYTLKMLFCLRFVSVVILYADI